MREKYLHITEKKETKKTIDGNAKTEIAKRIANILDDYIRNEQINAKDFAAKAKIKPSTFNGYKNGDTEPKLEQLKRIANVMNVSTDYLLGKSAFKSPDNIDILINEKLGLSELAIQNLKTINSGINEWLLDTINFLLENELYYADEYLLEQNLAELDLDERYSNMSEQEKQVVTNNIESQLKALAFQKNKNNPQYVITKLDEFFTTHINNSKEISLIGGKVLEIDKTKQGLEKTYTTNICKTIVLEDKLLNNVLLDEIKYNLLNAKNKFNSIKKGHSQ